VVEAVIQDNHLLQACAPSASYTLKGKFRPSLEVKMLLAFAKCGAQ